jgi:hypothetical protein
VNDQWKTCSAEGCDRKARTKGATYCDMHYHRVRKFGVTGSAGTVRGLAPGVCTVEDCGKTCRSSGCLYCEMHYCRLLRTGTLTSTRLFPYPEACLVGDCTRKPNSHGYCGMHATRITRHGSPHTVIAVEDRQFRRGSAASHWLPDDIVDYRTVHMRLRRYIGSARTMQCTDCGERKAVHWSYDHQDPDERMTPDGVPYSIKPEHYQPRCASCHQVYDRAHLRREGIRKALADLVAAAKASGNAAAAEFAQAHLESEWPRFTAPSCDGRWLDYVPEGAVA